MLQASRSLREPFYDADYRERCMGLYLHHAAMTVAFSGLLLDVAIVVAGHFVLAADSLDLNGLQAGLVYIELVVTGFKILADIVLFVGACVKVKGLIRSERL